MVTAQDFKILMICHSSTTSAKGLCKVNRISIPLSSNPFISEFYDRLHGGLLNKVYENHKKRNCTKLKILLMIYTFYLFQSKI